MKRIAKIMTVALLVIVAALSASAAKVELNLTDAGTQGDYTSGVYYLDVVASDDLYVNVLDLKFTFNTEKIQLFCLDAEYGAFPLNEEVDPEWYAYAETALVLGTNGKTGLQKATFSKSYVAATVDGNKCTAQFTASAPSGKITKFPKEDFKVYQIGLYIPGDVAELTAEDFKIEHMFYYAWDGVTDGVTNKYGYGSWSEPVVGQIAVTNNVVDEAAPITIPVAEGDVVYYLQDGSVVTITEANEAYEVPADAGYVVVNSGKLALNADGTAAADNSVVQKTYYVDGASAVVVHENAVAATDSFSIRTPVATDSDKYGEDRSGLRFKFGHAIEGRTMDTHKIVEVGFIMTAESSKVLTAAGADYVLDMDMVNNNLAKKGVAYNTSGVNVAFNTENDEFYIISGVFYNIPMKNANTTIASRPYYVMEGGKVVYGEVSKTSLYNLASAIKADADKWASLDESQKSYITEILFSVDGPKVIEEEIVIDISGLYSL